MHFGIGFVKNIPVLKGFGLFFVTNRYQNLSLGTVSFGLGWSRMISGLFWKSLGLANFFLGIGETSLGIGLTYLGLGETSLGYLSGSLGLVSVSADLQKWSRRRCLETSMSKPMIGL